MSDIRTPQPGDSDQPDDAMQRVRRDGAGGRQLQGSLHQYPDLCIAKQERRTRPLPAAAETLKMRHFVPLVLRLDPNRKLAADRQPFPCRIV